MIEQPKTQAAITYNERHAEIAKKLKSVIFPEGKMESLCWVIGAQFDVTGQTVKNYINGNIKDGFLAESIYDECVRLGYVKKLCG